MGDTNINHSTIEAQNSSVVIGGSGGNHSAKETNENVDGTGFSHALSGMSNWQKFLAGAMVCLVVFGVLLIKLM